MRAVVQRVLKGSVSVDGTVVSASGPGLVVLLAVKKGDAKPQADYMADKILNLRIFEDEDGKMNRSLLETGGEILLVSQFTLYGDCRKGRRPGFDAAELPEAAQSLFNYTVGRIREHNITVNTGVFKAHMMVGLENDGPCTILLDSERNF
ncbi:MAG: D-aminoacyl-tRNA deacylase [Syntrophomonadaceae bacterium]|nr:D-aminoacyl-tRNA deacylase [Syntrophomonadaceae bacterium]